MAQHDYIIDNQLFPQFRADINAVLQAIITQNSGPSEPSVFGPGTFWYDSVAQVLKRRNDSNTAWVALASVDLTPEQIASIIDQQLGDLATKDTVGVGDLDPAVVGTAELSDGAATLAKLATNSVDNTKVVTNTLALNKLIQLSANVLLGRDGTSGNAIEVACTSAGRALIDDATAADQRSTLGLGTLATQNASSVAVTGGSITGITDLAVADGGTGASTAANARTNLGLGTAATTSYETGTWTPVIAGSTVAGTQTYTTQNGWYHQIGTLVVAGVDLIVTSFDAATNGTLLLTNLPKSISTNPQHAVAGNLLIGWTGVPAGSTVNLRTFSATTFALGFTILASGAYSLANLTHANTAAGSTLKTVLIYRST